MAAKLNSQQLGVAFRSRPDIVEGIRKAADTPERIALFNEITSHVSEQTQGPGGEPAHKKRRLDQENGSANGASGAATNSADEAVLLAVREISVSVPQRKKFEICFTQNHIYARAPGTTGPVAGITYAWSDIEHVFFLPVPEKAQVQHNYILFPRGACLPARNTTPPPPEPLVFTVPSTPPKPNTVLGSEAGAAAAVSDTFRDLFHWAIGKRLRSAGTSVSIVSADPNKFQSAVRQPHRPNEMAVHVGGFRGSKDGFLFFLETGILWGFKKPLIFIPLSRVAAVSYTNILQITFNMVVEAFAGEDGGEATEEFEFGMLDQKDFAGIHDYVKLNRLQDGSMGEQRKAKLELAENRPKKADGEGENGTETTDVQAAGNGMSELAKANFDLEQQMQDDEDDDEEDYDPGSDAGSGGSGNSSDEDDDDDDDDEDDAEGEGEEGEDGEDGEEAEEEPEEAAAPPRKVPSRNLVKEEVEVKHELPPASRGFLTSNDPMLTDNMEVDEKFDVGF